MTGATLQTRLAACLQEAGMACLTCDGFGSTVVSEDYAYVRCPECGGDGITREFKQESHPTEAEWNESNGWGEYADEDRREIR